MKKLLSILAISTMALCFTSCDKTAPDQSGQNIVVQPTWGEAFHYANKATPSQVPFTILALVLLIGWPVTAVIINKVSKKSPVAIIVIGFLLSLGFGLFSLLGKPNQVRMDNVPTVSKEYFDRVGQTYILDSLFDNNLMTGAANKK